MDLQLAGRRALVTGGSRGIGKAGAAALRAEGATVTIAARASDALEGTAAELSATLVVPAACPGAHGDRYPVALAGHPCNPPRSTISPGKSVGLDDASIPSQALAGGTATACRGRDLASDQLALYKGGVKIKLGPFVGDRVLSRVPGPADRDEMDAMISAYGTGVTLHTACTIGTVACPPQVIMLTLIAPLLSPRLTAGQRHRPTAVGVRSIAVIPASP